MQKGKAATSLPTTVLSRGPSQQNTREPPSSRQRPDDFNQRQQQTFPADKGQIPGPLQMQYRPQQPTSGAFTPVSGPSQGPGHFGYTPQQTIYPIGQPSGPLNIIRAPAAPMNTLQQYSPSQNFEPRARERKIIQIKDPNSNKDVTQEILKRQPSGSVSGSVSGSTGGTPTNTPDVSGQSSRSSTPPLSSRQQDVQAQFAAQVAATLTNDTHKNFELTLEGSVGEEIMLKAPQSEGAEVEERVNGHEAEAKTASVTKNSTDVQGAGKDMKKKKQNKCLKDMEKQFSEKGVDLIGAYTEKPVNEEANYEQIPGPPQMQYRPQQPMPRAFTPISGSSQGPGHFVFTPQQTGYSVGQPSHMYILRATPPPMNTSQQYSLSQNFEPRARERKIIQIKDPNSNKDVTQEILKRQPSGSVSGSVSGIASGSTGGTPTNTPDISGQSSSSSTPPLTSQQQDVQAQFAAQVAATLSSDTDENFELTLEGSVGEEITLKTPQSESAEVEERVNGHEAKAKTASVTKNSTDVQGAEASFPELDEKPKRQDGGRLTYERDFLLQFQAHPMCMLKPEGLPDLEIVLGQARTPSRSRFSQNRVQPKDVSINMFLPAYLRKNSRQLKRTKKR